MVDGKQKHCTHSLHLYASLPLLFLFVSLWLYLFPSLSVCLSLLLYVSVCLSVSLLFLSFCLFVAVSLSVRFSPPPPFSRCKKHAIAYLSLPEINNFIFSYVVLSYFFLLLCLSVSVSSHLSSLLLFIILLLSSNQIHK